MAAKVALLSLFFQYNDFGWSEQHAFNDSGDQMLDNALGEAIAPEGLLAKRFRLMGGGVVFKGVRASVNTAWRDSKVLTRSTQPSIITITTPTAFAGDNPADNPYSVTIVRHEMGPYYRRFAYLSGFPQSQQPEDTTIAYDATFSRYFVDYCKYLSAPTSGECKWGTLVSLKPEVLAPAPNISQATPPSFVTVGGTSVWTVTLTGALGAAQQGKKIRVLGIKTPKGVDSRKWNGVFTISLVGGGGTVISMVAKEPIASLPTLDTSGAYAFVIDQAFKPYTSTNFEGQTHRKRGRPFGSPRGRSNVKA